MLIGSGVDKDGYVVKLRSVVIVFSAVFVVVAATSIFIILLINSIY